MTVHATTGLRPDVVLVVTDQQRADQWGHRSGGRWPTPVVDALAAEGVVFESAYSTSTTCVPSRVGLLTGLLHHRAPRLPELPQLPEGEWTIAHALRGAGYQTALVGKMHFQPIRADHGFDTLRICEDLRPSGGYTRADVDDYHEWLVAAGLPDWREGWSGVPATGPFSHDASVHPTGWVAREAIEVLERRDPTRPLFLVVSFPNPHAPYNPPEPYWSARDPGSVVLPGTGFEVNDELPPVFREALAASSGRVRSPDAAREMLATIAALIAHIDDAIGAVLARIDLASTVVAVTSDHGDYGGHRGLLRKTPWIPFDDLAKVGLVVAGAGVRGGRRIPEVVQSADVVPTFLEVAGAPVPDGLDAESLLPQLRGAPGRADRVVLSGTTFGWPMARKGMLKMMMHRRSGEGMVIDLEHDPDERRDARDDPRLPELIRDLFTEMITAMGRPGPDLPRLP